MAVIFGIATPVFLMLVVGAVELFSVVADNTQLQDAADSGALAGAQQLRIAEAGVEERVKAIVETHISDIQRQRVTTTAEVLPEGKVRVTIEGRRPSFLANMLPPGGWRMHAVSTATTLNMTPLCMLAFGSELKKTINLKDTAKIDARNCLIHSNGELTAENLSWVQAAAVQTVKEASGRITPAASVGTMPIPDPFGDLDLDHGFCDTVGLDLLILSTEELPPGVHCGIYKVSKGGTLKLAPGEHYFAGAYLEVKESGVLQGKDVVLILDKNAKIKFQDEAKVDLEGRKSGPLAGFLLITSRNNTKDLDLWSDNIDNLLGVVYAPSAKVMVDGKEEIAEDSDWTVVVAKSIELKGSASLKLNTNYAGSLVPVPEGVGPSGMAKLVR